MKKPILGSFPQLLGSFLPRKPWADLTRHRCSSDEGDSSGMAMLHPRIRGCSCNYGGETNGGFCFSRHAACWGPCRRYISALLIVFLPPWLQINGFKLSEEVMERDGKEQGRKGCHGLCQPMERGELGESRGFPEVVYHENLDLLSWCCGAPGVAF